MQETMSASAKNVFSAMKAQLNCAHELKVYSVSTVRPEGTAGPRHLALLEAMKQSFLTFLLNPISPPSGTRLGICLQHRHPEHQIFCPT